MTTLPEAGIGEELEAGPVEGAGVWVRMRGMASPRMGYALADQVAYSFGNMVVAALLSRHCAQREFGIYILTQRAMDVLLQLCNVFLWGPCVFNLPGTAKGRQKVYLGSVFAHQLVCCVLAGFVMWGAGKWASTPERGMYYGVFWPLVWTSGGIIFREFTRRMYFAEMRMKEAFWTDVATVALQIAGVEWLWLYRPHELNVTNTLWMLCGGAVIVSLWWLVREWRTFQVQVQDCLEDLRLNLRLGRWFLGSNMLFVISSQCNPWVLGGMLGPISVGAYTKCESVVNIPRVALTSLQNIMAPMMARAYADGGKVALKKMVRRMDTMLLGGSVLCALGIVVFGKLAARLIFKTVPDNAEVILVLLGLNLVAFAATMAQGYGLTAIDKAGYTFYANVVGLIVQFGAVFWMVRLWHVPGAAAALLLGSVVVIGVRQVYYSREMRHA